MREKPTNIEFKALDPVVSDKIVECQIKEIELREKELELKKKQNDNNYEYAKQSLKYQSEDFREQRKREILMDKMGVLLMSISILLFFGFITAAMFLNKDDLLKDVIKIVGFIFGGGITGYGIGLQRAKRKSAVPGRES